MSMNEKDIEGMLDDVIDWERLYEVVGRRIIDSKDGKKKGMFRRDEFLEDNVRKLVKVLKKRGMWEK